MLKRYKIVDINLFLVTDYATWQNCDIKTGNLANFVLKFDINLKKWWIGFNVNSVFESIW